jgi:hypothetical protein
MTGAFGSATAGVSATITSAQLATLTSGNHPIYVHGQDANGTWGAFSSAVLKLDKAGPTTSGLTLTPNPSNGTVNVALHATGNDTATGGSNITAAEYFIGATGADGSGTSMSVNAAAPIASLDATISAPVTAGVVSVHAMDAMGNWGPFAMINLSVVTGGPTSTITEVKPNPSNGLIGYNANSAVVRVTASFTAASGATVAGAELFIDSVGASGSGVPFTPTDGVFNSASESGFGDIPLGTVRLMSNGPHTIYVHARDAAGNWGDATASTATLTVDTVVPTITSATLTPNTILPGNPSSVTLNVTTSDGTGTGVTGGQYWVDGSATPPVNPTTFTGASLSTSLTTNALAAGTHTVYVRAQDAAGNWSAVSSVPLYVVQAVNDSRSFNANGSTTQTDDANAAAGVLANDEPVGVAGRTAALASAPTRATGGGSASIVLSCPASLGTAGTSVGGSVICTNGAYRVGFTNVTGNNNNQRAASKRGTFTFTYTEMLNSVTSNATVTITVN